MDSLPPEVLRKILLHLVEEGEGRWFHGADEFIRTTPLAGYAVISHKWQSIVEPFTFRNIHLDSSRVQQAEAYNYFGSARLAHIRNLWFDIPFPAHDLQVSTDPEDYDDQAFFKKAVRQILGLLARIPSRSTPLLNLVFSISPGREHKIPWKKRFKESEEDKVFSGQLRKTYLELDENWDAGIHDLPEISTFRTSWFSQALVFAPASINLIASKMTRLKRVDWFLDDAEKIDSELRIRQRTAFANTLKSLPRSIENFELEYVREAPRDRTFQAPSIVPADATGDILSQELWQFSQRDGLKAFSVHASVSSAIVWPNSQNPGSVLTWPTLENFHIELNPVLPSGEWIEMRDPDEEDELFEESEEDERIDSEVPGEEFGRSFNPTYNPTHFERFALATARAASRMPRIKELCVTYRGQVSMGIGFITSDRPARGRKKDPYLEFTGGKLPDPSEETMDAWRSTLELHGLEWDVNIAVGGESFLIDSF